MLRRHPHPSHPGWQCFPHSPATGDWCLGPQRPLACLLLSPSHHVGRSWGQAGTGRSQGRSLEEEHGGLVRTTGQNASVGGGARGTSETACQAAGDSGGFMVFGGGLTRQRSRGERVTHARGQCNAASLRDP